MTALLYLILIAAVLLGFGIGQCLTMTASLFMFILIASVVIGLVGGVAREFYWKRNPNGYVYTLLGRRRRHRWDW